MIALHERLRLQILQGGIGVLRPVAQHRALRSGPAEQVWPKPREVALSTASTTITLG